MRGVACKPPRYYDNWIEGKDEDLWRRVKEARGKEYSDDMMYTLQVAPEDCTGCALCVEVCPVKNKKEIRKNRIFSYVFGKT